MTLGAVSTECWALTAEENWGAAPKAKISRASHSSPTDSLKGGREVGQKVEREVAEEGNRLQH